MPENAHKPNDDDAVQVDVGCPACGAPPEEMCWTATGKVRDDHAARRKANEEANRGR